MWVRLLASLCVLLSTGYILVAAALLLLLLGASMISPRRAREAVVTSAPTPQLPATPTELPLAPLPAPASPELRSGAIGVLPFDVLQLIFGAFHDRQLMSIISLVCKRWRRAVLPRVKHVIFESGRWAEAHALLSQATRVTEVTLCPDTYVDLRYKFVLPPATTRLDSLGLRSLNLEAHLVVPPLRELRVPAEALQPLAFLFTHSHSLLETLHLTTEVSWPIDQLLTNLHLPSLSALKAPPKWHETNFLPFFARHAPQLTRLDVLGSRAAPTTDLVALPLTRLRSLTLLDMYRLAPSSLEGMLRRAPQLTELVVRNVLAVNHQPLSLLTSLVACSTSVVEGQFRDDQLVALPRLRKIRFIYAMRPRELFESLNNAMLLRVTHLSLRIDLHKAAEQASLLLRHTPNLEKLCVASSFPTWGLDTIGELSRLRVLKVDHKRVAHMSYEQLVAPISALMALAPSLRRVCLMFGKGIVLGPEAPLCAMVQALVQRRCAFEGRNLSAACAQAVRKCCTVWDDVKLL